MDEFLKVLRKTIFIVIFVFAFPVFAVEMIQYKSISIEPERPCQNSEVAFKTKIVDSAGTPVPNAKVRLTVKYKTTSTSYDAGKTNKKGKVRKEFSIGRATPNYKVVVESIAERNGMTISKNTMFTAKKCT